MNFLSTRFESAWLIEPDRHEDERGFFARTWCQREFEEHGLNPNLVQCNVSFNIKQGTLRGMHFQAAPDEEAKVVRCTQGSIFDVIIDVRDGSPTFGEWQSFELSASNRTSLFVPKGFAHGFQTLVPETEVSYQMSDFFLSASARGIHYADRTLSIPWPMTPSAISDRDRSWPILSTVTSLLQGAPG